MSYLVKVSDTYFTYSSHIGEREVSQEQAALNWKAAYPEHATSIEVIDAPPVDADGKLFRKEWGWSYKKTDVGFKVHAVGR